MSTTTYSFDDVSCVISHPSKGQYATNGKGLGGISISMSTDRSVHDLSADGSVMVSKIRGRNGLASITAQQTSSLHKWLLKLYNYLEAASASEWAEIKIIIRSPMMEDLVTCSGVSFQKIPDKPYQAQGQNISWPLMAADIQHDAL